MMDAVLIEYEMRSTYLGKGHVAEMTLISAGRQILHMKLRPDG